MLKDTCSQQLVMGYCEQLASKSEEAAQVVERAVLQPNAPSRHCGAMLRKLPRYH